MGTLVTVIRRGLTEVRGFNSDPKSQRECLKYLEEQKKLHLNTDHFKIMGVLHRTNNRILMLRFKEMTVEKPQPLIVKIRTVTDELLELLIDK